MIITQQQMVDIFCKTTKKKKVITYNCTFPDYYETDEMFYAGFVGLIISIVALLVHMMIMMIHKKIRNDFTKCFVSATFLPLTIASICKVIQVIQGMMYVNEDRIGVGIDIFVHTYTVSITAGCMSALLGSICFIFTSAFTVCRRETSTMENYWSIFLVVEFFSWILSGIYHFCDYDYRLVQAILLIFVIATAAVVLIISLLSGLITLLLCGKKKMVESLDPVVFDARTRLGSALIFSLIICIPAFILLYFVFSETSLLMTDDYDIEIKLAASNYYTFRLVEFFVGPIMALSVFLLPSYRTGAKSMCVLKRKNNKMFKKTQQPLLATQVHPEPVVAQNGPLPEKFPIPSDPASLVYPNAPSLPPPLPGAIPDIPGGNFIEIPPNYNATVIYTAPHRQ